MKILVTGGGGFLGSRVCRLLNKEGHDVIAFQRSAHPELEAEGIKVVSGSLLDPEVIRAAIVGCEAVIHTAAKAGVWGKRESFFSINVEGTRNVIKAAKEIGVRYFVHTSTPSVVFSGEAFAGADETLPLGKNWLCAYAESKAQAEAEVLAENKETFRVCALRPHLIWGKGDPHLVPTLLEAGRAGRLKIVGEGRNQVDMTHVENAARAHVLALEALQEGRACGEAYFLSDGSPVNLWGWVNDLFEMHGLARLEKRISLPAAYKAGAVLEFIWKLLRKESTPPMTRFVAVELAKDHWFSIEKAKRDFGYDPKTYTMGSLLEE